MYTGTSTVIAVFAEQMDTLGIPYKLTPHSTAFSSIEFLTPSDEVRFAPQLIALMRAEDKDIEDVLTW